MTSTVDHPRFARVWSRLMRHEPPKIRKARAELVAGLHGRVLEIGAGTGSMFDHYPATVDEVVAIEPEALLAAEATAAAAARPADARPAIVVRPEPIEALAGEEERFDAVVCSLVLCSVPDPDRALRVAATLLRPGGELRYYEHVAAEGPLGGLQRAVDATFWPRAFGGCHTHRDTASAIARAGFEPVRHRDLRIAPRWTPVPIAPMILGSARRPA